jgi:RsiW-degrading membrane proteinase PrsW (M82 family)
MLVFLSRTGELITGQVYTLIEMLELLVLAIVPAILIIWYIYRRDRYEPEPKYLVAKIFLLGALSVFPAILLEMPFPSGVFLTAIVAPVVEEGLKFSVVFFFVYKSVEFDEPMDGIVYAAAAGLGFATVENLFYVLEGGVIVGLVRGLLSVPGHMIFSCIWGFALGIAKFRPEAERGTIILLGLAGAMIMHSLFNLSLELFEYLGLVILILVLVPLGWWILHRNIESAHHQPNAAHILAEQSGPATAGNGIVTVENVMKPVPTAERVRGGEDTGERINGIAGYCTECGAPYRKGARYCRGCGKPLGAE